MCGRYRLSRRKQLVDEYFDTVSDGCEWTPRYNIAPTQPVPVIRQNPKEPIRELSLMRWGLIPSWAKDSAVGAKMINARSETAGTKPAFRDALQSRRCLIPADGFYEWQRVGKTKQPYCFEVGNAQMFVFAGIWDRWKDPSGNWMKTCSILTTTPNAVTSAVHDRMPVILDSDIPRLVSSLEQVLAKGVHLRIVLGDRESNGENDMERQRQELGKIVVSNASILRW